MIDLYTVNFKFVQYGILISFCFLFFCSNVNAQVYSNRPIGEKNKTIVDSLKQSEYPYVLPMWGAKAVEAGFDLPYSGGLGVNYI